jgi:hypothetical protein
LATASTRRRALGIMAGGVAALWGLLRSPLARARLPNKACQHSEECRDSNKCCCILPHGPHPGVCLRPDQCHRIGGFCAGVKKG